MLLFYLSLLETEEEQSKFEKLYYRYNALMKYIAFEILRDDGMAEDAVHDAFVKLSRHLDTIDDVADSKTAGFIIILIKYISLDKLKKRKRCTICDLDEVADDRNVEEIVLGNISAQEILEKIASLPDIHRDILMLKVYYEYPDKKIADILGISHRAARKRLQRARSALAKLLEMDGEY